MYLTMYFGLGGLFLAHWQRTAHVRYLLVWASPWTERYQLSYQFNIIRQKSSKRPTNVDNHLLDVKAKIENILPNIMTIRYTSGQVTTIQVQFIDIEDDPAWKMLVSHVSKAWVHRDRELYITSAHKRHYYSVCTAVMKRVILLLPPKKWKGCS